MNRNTIIIALLLGVAMAGGYLYRSTNVKSSEGSPSEKNESHDEHAGAGIVRMSAGLQKENGVVVVTAARVRLGEVISSTGKVAANADRMAHVSPRISGKIITVNASLGDSVSTGQPLVLLDSVELGEALGRYHQSKTKFALAHSNMERIKSLVEKKIAARKEIFQAESEFRIAQTELQTDTERLALYGVLTSDIKRGNSKKPLLRVCSPIGGIITEKHAIVGELSDPSKSLYTVVDLSTVWVLVDINEKDIAKVYKGQKAFVTVSALPGQKLQGHITHIADLIDEATRTVKARVSVANPGRKLKPEMFATVDLALPAGAEPILAVPEEALQDIDGKKVLFVTANGTEFEARPIEAGRATGGMVLIVSGLRENERYAIKGSFILKSELKKGELEGDAH